MKPLAIILALYLEPIGPITDEPWNFATDQVEEVEIIDLGPSLEEMEQQLQRRNRRIMELNDTGCQE